VLLSSPSSISPFSALLGTLTSLAPCPSTLVVLAYPPRLPTEARFIEDLRAHFEVSIGQLNVMGGSVVVLECSRKLQKRDGVE
jgi:hypothetical protein